MAVDMRVFAGLPALALQNRALDSAAAIVTEIVKLSFSRIGTGFRVIVLQLRRAVRISILIGNLHPFAPLGPERSTGADFAGFSGCSWSSISW
jgi:hypothetical protein